MTAILRVPARLRIAVAHWAPIHDGKGADQDAAEEQDHMGHVIERHGAAAKLLGRVGLDDSLRQGVGGDMNDADQPHQQHR